jgi:hypothetical protein
LLLWRLFISSELLMGTKTMSAFEREPGVWSVEKIDDDGGIEQAIFIGPGAERRCRKYAAFDAAAAVDGDAQWNAAIEEAAKVADDEDQNIAHAGQHNNWVMRQDALKECAAAIRSLKRLK